jgi:hypothetical protein
MPSEAPQWKVRNLYHLLMHRMHPNLPVQVLHSGVHVHGRSVRGVLGGVRHPGMLRGSPQVHRMMFQSKRFVPAPAVL